jgi:hypothetical protein
MSRSINEIIMEILKIMGVARSAKKVPFMNSGYVPLSTNRYSFVAYHHINTSNELVIITIMQ